MKNWLIRFFGGVTPNEFAQLMTSSAASNKSQTEEISWLRRTLEDERAGYFELQDIILRRHNVILPAEPTVHPREHLKTRKNPHESWPSMRARLENEDRKAANELKREALAHVNKTEAQWKGKGAVPMSEVAKDE